MNIYDIKPNGNNPRSISHGKLERLMASIKDFPKMMALRPIVVNRTGVILGGNMRYQALIALGYKEIPDHWIKIADQLNADEERRFIIEDNVAFGEWDFDMLANEWDSTELEEWGLDVWQNKDDKEKAEKDTARPWCLKIEFQTEAECAEWFEKLSGEGLKCKIT